LSHDFAYSFMYVNVTFSDRLNDQDVFQPACTLCGDCNSGCNYGSKNTVLMNYLPDAKTHGAEFYCEISAQYLSQNTDGSWTVYANAWGDNNGTTFKDPQPISVIGDTVILGAGSLGSTEILLRSQQKGLSLSNKVGQNFGCKI